MKRFWTWYHRRRAAYHGAYIDGHCLWHSGHYHMKWKEWHLAQVERISNNNQTT